MKLKLNIQRFASTNKTAIYYLSQYVGCDKPTYLGDYNSDMSKIDTQMKANSTAINEVDTKADLAKNTADTALQNADLAQTTANEANTTATSALQKSLTNEANINKFNFTNFKTYATSELTISQGSVNDTNLTVATNSDGSIAKIYGQITTNFSQNNGLTKITLQSSLRPKENIYISSLGMLAYFSNTLESIYSQGLTIKTDGTIEIDFNVLSNITTLRFMFTPAILFMENFGDNENQSL